MLAGLVLEPDTAQEFGAVLGNRVTVQCDGLIVAKTAAPVHLGRVNAAGVHVSYGSGYKEGLGLLHLYRESIVYVASVDDVERPMLQDQNFQNIDLVPCHAAVDECKNRDSEVEQGMQLDGYFSFAERRQVEQTQSQIDSGGFQWVDRDFEIERQVLVRITLANEPDKNCS